MLSVYLVVGAFTGLLAGLFGVGGGVIIIPALSAIFLHQGNLPQQDVMQLAIGTSLAIMVITSISSLYAHHKQQGVRYDVFKRMMIGLVTGVITGVIITSFLPSSFLQIFFGVFLLLICLRLLISKQLALTNYVMSDKNLFICSVVIGTLASILGIGGGTILVPFLLYYGLEMTEATGTSVACGLLIGIVATIFFMVSGWLAHVTIPDSTGYVYWPAFFGIVIASTLFAPVGAILSHKLPKELVQRLFAVLLFLMALDMLLARFL